MRIRRTHEGGHRLPGGHDVGGKAASTGQQLIVFQAAHRLAAAKT